MLQSNAILNNVEKYYDLCTCFGLQQLQKQLLRGVL